MDKSNFLPYFKFKNKSDTYIIAQFLLKKIKRVLKIKLPYHYLISARNDLRLRYIHKMSKKFKYFLKFDIEKYYPSINHQILLAILGSLNFKSRRFKHYLKYEIPCFLQRSPFKKRGLPLGNYLSFILAGIYLLPLDFKIKRPFLRVQDDYLIFCKNKKEPEKILKEIIEPELEKLELKINIDKLKSGQFHQNPVTFMGFKFYTGIFTISESKIEEFKNKIIKITHLTKKKPIKAVIKQLNNKILGFGHYYKFSYCHENFKDLDAFIRQRLRRYMARNKNSKNKLGNLILTNQVLKIMGLKSLEEIGLKYGIKKRFILKKKRKKLKKSGRDYLALYQLEGLKNIDKSLILTTLKKLTEITEKLNKIEKRLKKMEEKMVKLTNDKKEGSA